ncbi:MAG TPA: TIGR03621 family F420-dependent LLM class oxidoreductase [Acidimicrobiales bacterium]|nr:TIGR03621 family F420-dependent LLM class oxidoreductase [Acidimicrobiales bacterium]
MRPFRFGFQIRECSAAELRSQAVAAEEAGFDVLHTWDHVVDGWSPLAPLLAMAEATTRIRVCPLVLNNDFHHPVHLAQELASIDHLTGGRLEVGIGAGHAFTEYAAIGAPFDPPGTRKARLGEAVELLRQLLDGQEVTFQGDYYRLEAVRTLRSLQDHVPILVGVNGKAALAHAARHADIIGLTMLGRTLQDGQRHEARWEPERLDGTVDYIRDQAGGRWDDLELNVLVQAVVVTEDRTEAAAKLAKRLGLQVEDALATPFLALGTHEEIAEHLLACRQRWGISYFSVRDIAGFAPVIERLRASVPNHEGDP